VILIMCSSMQAMCKPSTKDSVKGYFLAGGTASWWQIGLSLFASNVSSEHFIGFAGAGAASGIAIVLVEWNAIFLILLLAWAFLPVYLVSGVYTLPEYLMRRFGGQRLRYLISIVFILSTILVPADLYSGGIFIQQSLGWNMYAGVFAIVLLAGIYSVFGGLLTVIYTDAIQVFIMLIGSLVLSIMAFIKVGGYSGLREKYMDAVASSPASYNDTNMYTNFTDNMTSKCGMPREDAWHIFRHPTRADYPSVAILLRMTIGGVFYWCAHQTIVQRTLAAKNISHAKGAAVLAGFLKLTPMFLMIMPGMISRVLYPNEVACSDPATCLAVCGSTAGCSNIAYPRLVLGVLPIGLRGLMVAVMLSAAVSSLTSLYNSIATVVALDLWVKVRPAVSDKELVFIGRVAVLIVIATSVSMIPVMQNSDGGQMIRYLTAVIGYLGAPLSSTFLVAMFWKRCTEKGAFWGFVVAAVCGMIRFVLDIFNKRPACGEEDTRPLVVSMVHPYYFTAIQIVLGIIISVIVSLFTKPRTSEQVN
ncbi:hypothetical protein CAPTEDRAFT_131177, partial [Capitella teleta]